MDTLDEDGMTLAVTSSSADKNITAVSSAGRMLIISGCDVFQAYYDYSSSPFIYLRICHLRDNVP